MDDSKNDDGSGEGVDGGDDDGARNEDGIEGDDERARNEDGVNSGTRCNGIKQGNLTIGACLPKKSIMRPSARSESCRR